MKMRREGERERIVILIKLEYVMIINKNESTFGIENATKRCGVEIGDVISV